MSHDPLHRALAPWLEPERAGGAILLAVSGGPDSTALMHAAAAAAPRATLHVATVDHRLRPGSAEEAESVAAAARGLGLPHHMLTREGAAPESGLQDFARQARYALLGTCAKTIGAGLVLTAHTRDDQAETVLMRLLAGSGPAGLAGMRRERVLAPGLSLSRPFLDIPKAELVAWCEARGIAYLRDPSNTDERFARARLRRIAPVLEREGLSAARLVRLAERARRDEDALSAAAATAFEAARTREDTGSEETTVGLDGRAVAALPEALALRVMALALAAAGAAGPDRLDRLERLVFEAIIPALREGRPVRRTLRGLSVAVAKGGAIVVAPAPPRRPLTSNAAARPDLLGKDAPSAYIGSERRLEHPRPGRAPAFPRD